MNSPSYNKAFLTYIARYLGVALIAGSIVHIGTLQNGVFRYIVLIILGLIMTLFGNIQEAKEHGQKINLYYLLIITGLSFATGFLSGGIQHYIDNPSYAGLLLGAGILVTYITFFLKEKIYPKTRNVALVALFAIALVLFSHFIMDVALRGTDYHPAESAEHLH